MTSEPKYLRVPPGDLKPNPWNSNVLSPDAEAKLEQSLLEFGVYKPVTCRELADGTLQILGGEHTRGAAIRLAIEDIPVINLGRLTDKVAKAIGLVDNGRYGEDDALKLASIIKDLAGMDVTKFLPITDEDLASLFAVDTNIDLDDLDISGEDRPAATLPEIAARAAVTHQLFRFNVPVADAPAIEKLLNRVMKKAGYDKETSLNAAGLALVDLCRVAEELL